MCTLAQLVSGKKNLQEFFLTSLKKVVYFKCTVKRVCKLKSTFLPSTRTFLENNAVPSKSGHSCDHVTKHWFSLIVFEVTRIDPSM